MLLRHEIDTCQIWKVQDVSVSAGSMQNVGRQWTKQQRVNMWETNENSYPNRIIEEEGSVCFTREKPKTKKEEIK